MTDLISFMQNLDAAAFLALAVVVGVIWFRRGDRSTGWLALAIVLLSQCFLLPYVTRVVRTPGPRR